MHHRLFAAILATTALYAADEVVFKSDVSLVRVDVSVLDRDNRAISGLRAEDFVLRDEGRVQPIRNFTSEQMPIDLLFLFDVSASMRPHVQRIADAAHDALRIFSDKDRVGIMVFDRSTRVRMGFSSSQAEVERELERMLRQESFRGGTDITRGLLDAADYIRRQGRRDARRAIVILTDDQTEFERDEARVGRSLENANAVLSALIAPDAMAGRYGGGGYPNGGGGYPGGGRRGGWGGGGPLGGIILGGGGGGRGGYGGHGPYGNSGGGRTKSAGTSEIARDSGGDSFPVDDSGALENTLSRLRQRYALFFLVPPGARTGQERSIEVALADSARRHYGDADVRFRRTYISPSDTGAAAPGQTNVTETTSTGDAPPAVINSDNGGFRRRRAVSEPDGPRVFNPASGSGSSDSSSSSSSSQTTGTPAQSSAPSTASPAPAPASAPTQGGWRKLKPGEQP